MSSQFHTPAALSTGKKPQVITGLEAEWTQEQFWMLCGTDEFLPLYGIKPWLLSPSAHSLVTNPTDECAKMNYMQLKSRSILILLTHLHWQHRKFKLWDKSNWSYLIFLLEFYGTGPKQLFITYFACYITIQCKVTSSGCMSSSR